MNSLGEYIEKLQNIALEPLLREPKKESKTDAKQPSGAYNRVRFKPAPEGRKIQFRFKKGTIVDISHLAVICPNEPAKQYETFMTSVASSHESLSREKVKSAQVQNLLYVQRRSALKITPKFHDDLHDYVWKKVDSREKINFTTLQRIFAQILLGVNALHQKNLVHCDLALENILCMNLDKIGELIKITDLDSVVPTKLDGTLLERPYAIGKAKFIAPEIHLTLIDNSYESLNFKLASSFSCGRILEELANVANLSPEESEKIKKFANALKNFPDYSWGSVASEIALAARIANDTQYMITPSTKCKKDLEKNCNPAGRLSIEKALTDSFFGDNPTAFIQAVADEFEHEIFIDGELADLWTKVDDPKNFLPPAIQAIIVCIKQLDQFFIDAYREIYHTPIKLNALKELHQNAAELAQNAKNLIQTALQNPQLGSYKSILNELLIDIKLDERIAETNALFEKLISDRQKLDQQFSLINIGIAKTPIDLSAYEKLVEILSPRLPVIEEALKSPELKCYHERLSNIQRRWFTTTKAIYDRIDRFRLEAKTAQGLADKAKKREALLGINQSIFNILRSPLAISSLTESHRLSLKSTLDELQIQISSNLAKISKQDQDYWSQLQKEVGENQLRFLTPQMLLDAIKTAIGNFIEKNNMRVDDNNKEAKDFVVKNQVRQGTKSTTSAMFIIKKYDQSHIKTAVLLYQQVERIAGEKAELSTLSTQLEKMHEVISVYLQGPDKLKKTSFKTFLTAELTRLSSISFYQWPETSKEGGIVEFQYNALLHDADNVRHSPADAKEDFCSTVPSTRAIVTQTKDVSTEHGGLESQAVTKTYAPVISQQPHSGLSLSVTLASPAPVVLRTPAEARLT